MLSRISLLLIFQIKHLFATAFIPTNGFVQNDRTSCSGRPDLNMIGNFMSGMIGKPPDSLDAPLSLLENTNIDPAKSNVDLECVYKASKDGFSAVDFHEKCDGRGSGLVVILTGSGKVFGGFNPLGWESTDDYGNTNSAFLFFEKNGAFKKCDVLSGGNAAIFDYATGGPQFGSVSDVHYCGTNAQCDGRYLFSVLKKDISFIILFLIQYICSFCSQT